MPLYELGEIAMSLMFDPETERPHRVVHNPAPFIIERASTAAATG
jgi:hypothetical protein